MNIPFRAFLRLKKSLAVIVSIALLVSQPPVTGADACFLAPPAFNTSLKSMTVNKKKPIHTRSHRVRNETQRSEKIRTSSPFDGGSGEIDIRTAARMLKLKPEEWVQYGQGVAKLCSAEILKRVGGRKRGKLILVTAINPPKDVKGIGKTTMNIGLVEGLGYLGQSVCGTLRQPSPGPTLGMKAGGTGAGRAIVVPTDLIDLGLTGDIDAVRLANNSLASGIENYLYHVGPDGMVNHLGLDPDAISFPFAEDVNAAGLRDAIIGIDAKIGSRNLNVEREAHWINTVATEIMAVLSLSKDIFELRKGIDRIIAGYSDSAHGRKPITIGDLGIGGHAAYILETRNALEPNLVQTCEGQPIIMHGAPFANIAHGCNSWRALEVALQLADYVVTEAGFGADLGAEKFMGILCRRKGISPDLAVLTVTTASLIGHGRMEQDTRETLKTLSQSERIQRIKKGFPNLDKHIKNLRDVYGVPVLVVINKFKGDTQAEFDVITEFCASYKDPRVRSVVCNAVELGGEGAVEYAKVVIDMLETQKADLKFAYPLDIPIKEKIEMLAKRIYGAQGVEFSKKAQEDIKQLSKVPEYCRMEICIAKTWKSLSHDENLLGAPKDWNLEVKEIFPSAGPGFLVVMAGDVNRMPALPWKSKSLMLSNKRFLQCGL